MVKFYIIKAQLVLITHTHTKKKKGLTLYQFMKSVVSHHSCDNIVVIHALVVLITASSNNHPQLDIYFEY